VTIEIGLKYFKYDVDNLNNLEKNLDYDNYVCLGLKTYSYIVPKKQAIRGLLYPGEKGIVILIKRYNSIVDITDSKSIYLKRDIKLC
jgi:hypothetical protein